jgi:hypothetical protein
MATTAGLATLAVAVAVVAAIGDDDAPDTATSTETTPTSVETTTEPTVAPTTTTPATTAAPAAPVQPTAEDALAGFFAAATNLDTQLHDAAAAINGSGPPWPTVAEGVVTMIQVPDDVVTAVQAADLAPVPEAIPAGLPDELLQQVILVYSDLSSRRHAMDTFGGGPAPATEGDSAAQEYLQQMLLEDLRLGGVAAARFDDDLDKARALAASTPAVTIPAPDAREAAERALLIQYVESVNTACGGRGGAVIAELPTIDWTPGTRDGIPTDGTVNGTGFTADLAPDGTWTIEVMTC